MWKVEKSACYFEGFYMFFATNYCVVSIKRWSHNWLLVSFEHELKCAHSIVHNTDGDAIAIANADADADV